MQINSEEIFKIGIIAWYEFKKNSDILIINSDTVTMQVITEYLTQKGHRVSFIDYKEYESACIEDKFNYVICIKVLEMVENPEKYLMKIKNNVSDNGKVLIGLNNRLGLCYYCGERDPYTGRNFDGVENYRTITGADKKYVSGRCYSKKEILEFLKKAGLLETKFYSVMPDLDETQLVYADGYLPKEDLTARYFPMYDYPDSVFMDERYLYKDMVDNDIFHQHANSYFIECSSDGNFCDVLHSTISLDRGEKDSLITSIKDISGNLCVEKKTVFCEGKDKFDSYISNIDYLKEHGVKAVDVKRSDNGIIMPYVDAVVTTTYLTELAKTDKQTFIDAVDKFRETVLKSSRHIGENEHGIILEKGFPDLVCLNSFCIDGEYVFFDQEFTIDDFPANAIIYRTLVILYITPGMANIIPMKFFLDRYGITEDQPYIERKAVEFINELRNVKQFSHFNNSKSCNIRTMDTNRLKMNYTYQDYQRIFVDIFKDAENKKIIIFGSGKFTERFLAQFKRDYDIYAILDNNKDKWGSEKSGIKICSPDILMDIPETDRHIIICIKNFTGTVFQLKKMGITDYHVFDPNMDYSRKLHKIEQPVMDENDIDNNSQKTEKKPYHIGYISGVFDLFHVGHLNMFKRAKEMCDYLIVGVVSDEGVRFNKKTEPFVPFNERIEMVRSCRFVDEAVEIPFNYCGTRDAYKMYHFDVQFSGSDYENDEFWLAEKEYLEKNGSTMVFFPYTQSTSSTKLKKLINEKLL